MPDWIALVRHKLSDTRSDRQLSDDVLDEIAGHLEEKWESLRAQGIAEGEALKLTLLLVEDWDELCQKIHCTRSVENNMNPRTKQLWLPGFLTLFLAMGLLALIQLFGPQPWTSQRRTGSWSLIAPMLVIYIPWLLSLPLVGALGAFLSARAGGAKRVVFASTVFPVLPYLGTFVIAFPVALIVDEHVAHNIMFTALLVGLFAWVVAPGLALLAGGMLAQIFNARISTSRQIAGS
jgi:hypothetical protein